VGDNAYRSPVGYHEGMGRAPNKDDPLWQQYLELVQKPHKEFLDKKVLAGEMSAEEAARMLRWYSQINLEQLIEFARVSFAARLQTRQGTRLPNFEAFYKTRAELDRKTIRPDQ
jgi:hypothetical protein